MTSSALIQELAELRGLGRAYWDYRGEYREFSVASQSAILSAMGVVVEDERALREALHKHEALRFHRPVAPTVVLSHVESSAIEIVVPSDALGSVVYWSVTFEDETQHRGEQVLSELAATEAGNFEGRSYHRLHLPLPHKLPAGYHRASFLIDGLVPCDTRLIVTRSQCYQPAEIQRGERLWGLTVQLYSLRSDSNWGIGDFADLHRLVELAAPLGCAAIGLNPLHALLPADPAHSSPYSPSSRLYLNVLYIAVTDVPEYADCAIARSRVHEPAFQQRLAGLRATADVDYVGVTAAKLEILRLLYAQFRASHLVRNTERATKFRRWVDGRGESLRLHAVYDALDAYFRRQGSRYWGWQSWPEEYRDPHSPAIAEFVDERSADVEFHLYLQWLAETQLAAAHRAGVEAGMAIGIYGDVAVGVNPNGSETWSSQKLYVQGASIGAPPDPLALKGQDWGIPPQDPSELKAQAYAPFALMLRNGMRNAGALRLDHVMALFRQWWVARGTPSNAGVYVHYPLEDLMGILALESVRNRCLVIGEDLGTVPEEMSKAMDVWGVYHYKVLLFEKHRDGQFKMPLEYPQAALATITTHDLPTLHGWWESLDIDLRERLDLYPSADIVREVRAERDKDRRNLLHAIVGAGLWRWHGHEPLPRYSQALGRAMHLYLGRTKSSLAMLQIEDLIGMTDPVNVPGTSTEHANWTRKVSMATERIFAREDVREMLTAMNRVRAGRDPNA